MIRKSYLIIKNQRHLRSICAISGASALMMFLLFAIAGFNAGFENKIDSLTAILKELDQSSPLFVDKRGADTTRINTLNTLAFEFIRKNPDTALLFATKALMLAKKTKWQIGIASSLCNIGIIYRNQGDYYNALKYFQETLKIDKELENKNGIAATLGNIGIIYSEQGNFPEALKHYQKAVEIMNELGNKKGIASALGNIGIVYKNQRDYSNALKYYQDALEIDKQLGNKNGIASNLSNIGTVYHEKRQYPNALKHFQEALEIDKKLGNKRGMSIRFGNIGIVYREENDYTNALKYYQEALEIDIGLGNKNGIARHLGNIGTLYTFLGRFEDAQTYLDTSLILSDILGALKYTMIFEKSLSHLYDTLGQMGEANGRNKSEFYKKAFDHYKKYSAAKDSLFNEEKSKEIGRLEQQHEYEMAEIARKQKEESVRAALAAALNRRNVLQYFAILIGIILFLGLIFLFARLHVPTLIVELSVFMLFLLIFEFTLVLLDPFIEAWTGGAPAWKLLVNAVLAGLIYPVHSWCERVMKKKIMERR